MIPACISITFGDKRGGRILIL